MKLLTLILLVFSQIAFAGDRVGNGGDVIICDEPTGETIFVLDQFYVEKELAIGPKGLSYIDKVFILLERVKKEFPVRYTLYSKIFNHFRSTVTFINSDIPEIDDSTEQYPINCDLKQAAYFNEKHEYFLSRKIWDRLSNDQKAVLVFHEILYTEAIGLGHSNSKFIARANRLAFLDRITPATFDATFIQPLRSMPQTPSIVIQQLKNAYSEGVALYLLQLDFTKMYRNKNLRPALLILKKRFNTNLGIITLIDHHLKVL